MTEMSDELRKAIATMINVMTREALGGIAETVNNLRSQLRGKDKALAQLETNWREQVQAAANARHERDNADRRAAALRSENDRLIDELRKLRDRSEATADGVVVA